MNVIEIGSSDHRRASASMLMGSIVVFAVLYSPQPLISLFSKEYHISPATAGASISLATIGLGIGLILISALSSALERKKLMSLSLLLTSFLTVLSAFCHQFTIFLIIRFLEGVCISGFPSIAMAYLNEEFHSKDIGRVMGSYIAGTAIGGFVGRIVIGALTDLFDWQIAMMILGMISLLLSLSFWMYLPESRNFHSHRQSFKLWKTGMIGNLLHKRLIMLFITGFLLMGVYIMILDYIGYPLTSKPYYLSQTVFGFLFVVNLVGTWSSVWFGKLADHHPRSQIIAIAIAIFATGTLFTLIPNLAVKILGVALVAFGFFAGHSIASGWVGLVADSEHKAQASSLYLLFYYGGSSVVGWSGGLFLHHLGWTGLVYYACVLLAAAIVVSSLAGGAIHLRRLQLK
ncbi:MFS transporter, YNFM family, putative membrane transport protein [Paenibacillus sophorae]|uniref:MFS transporter n=1 Tax=Paenibacillus sophorae TaxID=1333845 RepID=A0A1H8K3V5_9BACL|nr:MFS transporter [Paenibacillus sophorae]QWU13599.1 MFS transporter [Paenibacillus sophorae]SEN87680.1 MFS transporter, YNFM family, putative membrane transport protein [Paenibacillus sophorae]